MPQSPPTSNSLECLITVGLLDGEIDISLSTGSLGGNGKITVEPPLSKTSVFFTTKNFAAGGDLYRVEGFTVTPTGDVAWAADPARSGHFCSDATARQGDPAHQIDGDIKIVVYGPLNNQGNSTTEVDRVEPPTTIVFEDDLGGPL